MKMYHKVMVGFLAILFTVALTFASLELPHLADKVLQNSFSFPGFDHGSTGLNQAKTELYIAGHEGPCFRGGYMPEECAECGGFGRRR